MVREIPKERFDVDVYFNADRRAKDKIYSKWGGFIDDVVIDPMKFGMPPSSLPSIDPIAVGNSRDGPQGSPGCRVWGAEIRSRKYLLRSRDRWWRG